MVQNFNNILFAVKDLKKPLNSMIFHLAEILNVKKIFLYQYLSHDEEQQNDDNFLDKDKYLEELKLHVTEIFPSFSQVQFEFLILNKDPLKEILKASLKLDIDLIICEYGSGFLKREDILKIAKNCYCSALIIPQNCGSSEIHNILVPVDFSDYSKRALDCALKLSSVRKIAVTLNHVFFVPSTYLATGKSYEESAVNEKQMAKKECQQFLKHYYADDLYLTYSYILDDDKDPTDKIYKDAMDNNADLIILGSKGKTNSPEVLTGSIAFSILLFNQQIPMMIIKNKKNNYDLAEEYILNMQ